MNLLEVVKMLKLNTETRSILERVIVKNEIELRIIISTLLSTYEKYFDAYITHQNFKMWGTDTENLRNNIWSSYDEYRLYELEKIYCLPIIPDILWDSTDESQLSIVCTCHLHCILSQRLHQPAKLFPRSFMLNFLCNKDTTETRVLKYIQNKNEEAESSFDLIHTTCNENISKLNVIVQNL